MARVQILPLTAERHGDDYTIPFVLVVDKLTQPEIESFTPDYCELLRAETGARAVWLYGQTLDVVPELELTAGERADLIARVLG